MQELKSLPNCRIEIEEDLTLIALVGNHLHSISGMGGQIFKAILKKKRRVYITKRWSIIAFILKIVPTKLLYKFTW